MSSKDKKSEKKFERKIDELLEKEKELLIRIGNM